MTNPPGRPDFTWEEFDRANQNEAPREDSRFRPCYRHPESKTGISCQRCGRPVCGACMVPASVGFHCPDCSGGGKSGKKTSRPAGPPRFARPSRPGHPLLQGASAMLFGGIAVLGILNLVTRNLVAGLLIWSHDAIAHGQVWRIVTGGLVSPGVLGLIITVLVGLMVCRSIEMDLGSGRMLLLYLSGTVGGSLALSVFQPVPLWDLTSAALFGCLAGHAVVNHSRGVDVRGILVLLGILVVVNLVLGFGGGGPHSLIGGLIFGGLAGYVLGYVHNGRSHWVWIGALVGVGVVGSYAASALI